MRWIRRGRQKCYQNSYQNGLAYELDSHSDQSNVTRNAQLALYSVLRRVSDTVPLEDETTSGPNSVTTTKT
jgi:hypothetical protein